MVHTCARVHVHVCLCDRTEHVCPRGRLAVGEASSLVTAGCTSSTNSPGQGPRCSATQWRTRGQCRGHQGRGGGLSRHHHGARGQGSDRDRSGATETQPGHTVGSESDGNRTTGMRTWRVQESNNKLLNSQELNSVITAHQDTQSTGRQDGNQEGMLQP